jgi:diguanylate cyclase (GGDEF)-like protein
LAIHRRFEDKVERLIADRADDPAPFTVGIIDLDGFKPINDLFGRKAGDDILMQVAMRLRASMDGIRPSARIGADEFAFLYPMVFSEEAAVEKVNMLIEILSAPYDVGERTARLSASVGLRAVPSATIAAKSSAAEGRDRALPRQALGPRPRRRLFPRDGGGGQTVTRIEQALRRAVAAGEVEAYFQPIVDLQTRRTIGFETLARWTDRDLGASRPRVFIPIAEERGIIGPLSQLVLRKATEAARNWPAGHLFLSFNLSPSQLVDQNTGLHILSILDRVRLRSPAARDRDHRNRPDDRSGLGREDRQRPARVRHQVSLDDFGTGQSSLGRLRDIPTSTSSRSIAPSSRRSSTIGRPSTSSAPSSPCAKVSAWTSSPKASSGKAGRAAAVSSAAQAVRATCSASPSTPRRRSGTCATPRVPWRAPRRNRRRPFRPACLSPPPRDRPCGASGRTSVS